MKNQAVLHKAFNNNTMILSMETTQFKILALV